MKRIVFLDEYERYESAKLSQLSTFVNEKKLLLSNIEINWNKSTLAIKNPFQMKPLSGVLNKNSSRASNLTAKCKFIPKILFSSIFCHLVVSILRMLSVRLPNDTKSSMRRKVKKWNAPSLF